MVHFNLLPLVLQVFRRYNNATIKLSNPLYNAILIITYYCVVLLGLSSALMPDHGGIKQDQNKKLFMPEFELGRNDHYESYADLNSLQQPVNDLFGEIVRKRRQLPRRKDEEKEGFTEEEKEALLLLHNSLRSAVTPTASDMVELTWDNDIEALAQEWASQCTGDHRRNRDLKSWINMGENLYWQGGGYYEEKKALDYWWNEKAHYSLDQHKCQPGEVCGHYITAAWAKSVKIGCGIKRCATLPEVGITRKTYYFVCNYSGRFLNNKRPYEEGDSCSKCPAEYPKCRYNLCVTDSMLSQCEGYNGSTSWTGLDRVTSITDKTMDCSKSKANSAGKNNKDGGGDGSGVAVTSSLTLLALSASFTILYAFLY